MVSVYPTKSRNSSTNASYLSGRSQAFTLSHGVSARWEANEPMRHWLAMSNTSVENNAVVEVEIRGVIKKGSENSHHGQQHV